MKRPSSPRRRRALVVCLFAAVTVAPAAAQASDCAPWIDVTAPADGDSWPSNGLLLVDAQCGGDPRDLEVFIDGRPASLWPERDRMLGLGYRITPAPAPGAFVELEGCPGFESCDEAAVAWGLSPDQDLPRGSVSLSFTVGERDRTAPTPPVLVDLDYRVVEADPHESSFDEPSFDEPVGPAREWSLALDGRAAEPVLYHVSLGPSGSDEPTRTRRVVLDGREDLELTLRRAQEDAGRDVCATVRTFDLTGNEADPIRLCRPLGRNETLAGGGACSVSGRGRSPLGALLILLLGLGARRRSRGSARRPARRPSRRSSGPALRDDRPQDRLRRRRERQCDLPRPEAADRVP